MSFQHLDGSEMMRFMHWAQAVVYFGADPAGYLAGASWLIKTHVVLGLTIFLLFPFSRLVHMISAPLRFFWRHCPFVSGPRKWTYAQEPSAC